MGKVKAKQVPVSERALFARSSRAIAKDDLILRRCRENSRGYRELGRYYTVMTRTNGIGDKDLDLVTYGRKVGALKPFECLARE